MTKNQSESSQQFVNLNTRAGSLLPVQIFVFEIETVFYFIGNRNR